MLGLIGVPAGIAAQTLTLESVFLLETERGAELEMIASGELAWTLRYDSNGGFAIRLPRAVRGPEISNLDFETGLVSKVRVRSLGDQNDASTLIEVIAREPLRVSISSAERLLRARISAVGNLGEEVETAGVADEMPGTDSTPVDQPADDDSTADWQARLASAETTVDQMKEAEEELRFELQRVRDERDDLSRSARVYRVVETASPCLNVRTGPDGRILDCLEPRTPMSSLSLQGDWAKVRLPDGREAWARSEFLEASAAPSPAQLQLELQQVETELQTARDRNRTLEERADAAEANLERAWDAQQNLSVQLAATQTSQQNEVNGNADLTASLQSLEAEKRDLERRIEESAAEIAKLTARLESGAAERNVLGGLLESVRDTLALGGSTYVVTGVDTCLNLRPEPQAEERIDCLATGTRTTVIDLLGEWGKLRLADGRTGWASMTFLEPAPALPEELSALSQARARVQELEGAATAGADLEGRVARLEGDNAVIQSALDQATLKVTDLEGALDASEGERAELQTRLDQTEADATARTDAQRDAEELRARLLTTDEELRVAGVERVAFLDRLKVLETDLTSAQAETDRRQSDLTQAESELAARRGADEASAIEGQRAAALEIELGELRSKVESLETERGEWQQRTGAAESQLADLLAEIQSDADLAAQLAEARDSLEQATDRVNQLEGDVTAFESELARLQTELDEGQLERGQQETAVNERTAALEAELASARTRVESAEHERSQWQKRTETALADLAQVRGALQTASGKAAELTEARASVTRAGERVDELERNLEALESDSTDLRARLEASESDLASRGAAAAATTTELQARLSSTRNVLKAAVEERDAAQRQSAELQSEIESIRATADASQTQTSQAVLRLAELEAERSSLADSLATAETERDQSQARLEETRRTLETASVQFMVTAEPCLNLRPEPGTGDPVDCLATGMRLAVAELSGEWARVRLASGGSGWAARAFIEPAPQTPPEIEALAAAKAELTELRTTFESRTKELEKEAAEATLARRQAESYVGDLQSELRTEKNKILESEAELRKSREKTAELEGARQQAGETVAELALSLATIERLEGELAGARKQAGETVAELALSLATIERLGDELAEARGSLTTTLDTRRDLEEQLQEATGTEAALEAANQQIAGLRDQVEAERRTRTELEQRLDATEAQTARLTELADLVEGQEAELGTTRDWLTAAEEEKVELEARVAASASFLSNLGEELRRERESNRALEEKLAEMPRAEALESEASELQSRLATLTHDLEGSRAESETLRGRVTALETELQLRAAAAQQPAEPAQVAEVETTEPEPQPELRTMAAIPRASDPAALAGADPADLRAAALGWARAWSEQDVDGYLGFYSKRFTPAGDLARSAWEEQRRVRVARPASLEVSLSDVEVSPAGDEPPTVRFTQSYRSDTFSDVVRKVLVLTREDGTWRILSETSTAIE